MKEIIRKKKLGQKLTEEEVSYWVRGIVEQTIPEYQSSALLMAIYFNGLNVDERYYLTRAMADSGLTLNFRGPGYMVVDKHSTGGVGDKTSLILAPMMASLGYRVPMISGRGLGFTGGTLDKLQAIENYKTNLNSEEMHGAIDETQCFIAGQTGEIAPADKVLYGLRDVTETVDEISLITASILSKKMAEGLDALVLDVKFGSGAFMKTEKAAEELAESLVSTCKRGQLNCRAVITRMDFPLGEYTGNLCETYEALQFMRPGSEYFSIFKEKVKVENGALVPGAIEGPKDNLVFVTIALAYHLLEMVAPGIENHLDCIEEAWAENRLWAVFEQMVKQQGGNIKAFEEKAESQLKNFADQSKIYSYNAPVDGFIASFDAETVGNLMVKLGAGRQVVTDNIDHNVSLKMRAWQNQPLKKGDCILQIDRGGGKKLAAAEIDSILDQAIVMGNRAENVSLLHRVID